MAHQRQRQRGLSRLLRAEAHDRALRAVVPTSQIVFGTDYPYRTPIEHVQALEAAKVFDARELAAIYRGNLHRSLGALLT